ncbi:MAG: Gfo/Idh/MocA family oxidoreductase [Armatimonadetes bacterium]|nr:Gfo/Idh/MocA family oxidoreductase [Armatimonadota bacterium]
MGQDIPRRHFLEGAAAATLIAALASGSKLVAAEGEPVKETDELPMHEVKLGLIGAGMWGKEIARSLAKVTNATLKTVCDSAAVEKGKVAQVAPKADFVEDYRKVLDDKAIQGVIIATPTHLHKQIVLDAIAAGKHVYCEAPLAVSMDDLTAICRAARDAQVVFQPGLQRRCHPLSKRVKSATVDGSIRQAVLLRSQARMRVNWMRNAATPERAKERSWQAYADTSLGPIGELGIHQIDIANYWLGSKPKSVTGFGAQTTWADSNWEVPDTSFATYSGFTGGARAVVESTVGSSHWGNAEELVGVDGTVLFRDNNEKTLGYLFKESGVASAGWEVYAKKADVLGELGIIMVATPPGGFSIERIESGHMGIMEPLHYALGSFAKRIDLNDPAQKPLVGWQKAFEANVIAIKSAAAIRDGKTVDFATDDFKLA